MLLQCIHSPLVGPATWGPFARVAVRVFGALGGAE
jgi:hypothetical protein